MPWTPNRICLIVQGRYDEATSGSTGYPGMLLQQGSTGTVVPHAVVGGPGPVLVAEEDALLGRDITQILSSGTVWPFRRAISGDLLLMLLKTGQNVTRGAYLISGGDGTLIAGQGSYTPYEIVAASTTITNTTTETTFSNGTYTFPANTLQVGDVIHLRAKATVTGQNSTNTHNVKAYLGTGSFAGGAVSLAANDVVWIDACWTVRTIGASGTMVGSALIAAGTPGTVTAKEVDLASTTLDTTAATIIKATSTASAASTGNIIRLDEFRVDVNSYPAGKSIVLQAFESKDNSGGTGTSGFNNAMFIRVMVP